MLLKCISFHTVADVGLCFILDISPCLSRSGLWSRVSAYEVEMLFYYQILESRFPGTVGSLGKLEEPVVIPSSKCMTDWSLQLVSLQRVLGETHAQGSSWTIPRTMGSCTGFGGAWVTHGWKSWSTADRWVAICWCLLQWDRLNRKIERYLREKECAAFLLSCFFFLPTLLTVLFTRCLFWAVLFLLSPTPVAFAEYFPRGVLWISFML